jgi:hypothetical protein
MKQNKTFLAIILLAVNLMYSCTKKADLKGFDLVSFQKDKGGCNGVRTKQLSELKALRQNLKGVSSNDILTLFGPPDIQRLSERNQEYFVYFMEPGPHCGAIKPISDAKSVIIRFSAIKLATEINFQNGSI